MIGVCGTSFHILFSLCGALSYNLLLRSRPGSLSSDFLFLSFFFIHKFIFRNSFYVVVILVVFKLNLLDTIVVKIESEVLKDEVYYRGNDDSYEKSAK